jgi:hypothetical protein
MLCSRAGLDNTYTRVAELHRYIPTFLGAFTKLEKRLLASTYLSVRTEKLGSHRKDFHKILYLSIPRKSVDKIQVSFNSDMNNGSLCLYRASTVSKHFLFFHNDTHNYKIPVILKQLKLRHNRRGYRTITVVLAKHKNGSLMMVAA